jgi:hypothetical protein
MAAIKTAQAAFARFRQTESFGVETLRTGRQGPLQSVHRTYDMPAQGRARDRHAPTLRTIGNDNFRYQPSRSENKKAMAPARALRDRAIT